jgi:hypothetical protein
MNKKLVIAVVALVVVIAVLAGVYAATRPEVQEGSKNVTIVIVYQDGTEKTMEFKTDAEHLSDLLVAEGLVDGYESEEFGYTITAVDGIYLDWAKDNAYWALYEGDAYATESAAGIVLVDGAVYRLVYESF